MATVTMTGKEYAELLNRINTLEAKINDIRTWAEANAEMSFDERTLSKWSAGYAAMNTPMPKWLQDIFAQKVIECLLKVPIEVIQHMESKGIDCYEPLERQVNSYGAIKLLELSEELRDRWAKAHNLTAEKLAAEENAKTLSEAAETEEG